MLLHIVGHLTFFGLIFLSKTISTKYILERGELQYRCIPLKTRLESHSYM